MDTDGVSVVTTTYNERDTLKQLILRIRKVLKNIRHEVIVVDDNSPDNTYEIARKYADIAIKKRREGQSKGLITGILKSKYPAIITIDADLENPPELIPFLLRNLGDYDILVASRSKLPRISEKITSHILGKIVGVKDFYSNYRIYRRDVIDAIKDIVLGETFGGEILLKAWARGYKIGEIIYNPNYRRRDPRLGNVLKSNIRIFYATIKLLFFLFKSLLIKFSESNKYVLINRSSIEYNVISLNLIVKYIL